jgi:uncharacterized protein YndB with AHSA1/START domain
VDDERDQHDEGDDGRDIASTSDDTTYRVETEFDADPSTVWRALTDPESMGEWLGRPVEFTLEPGAEGTLRDDDDGDDRDRDDDHDDAATVLVVEEVDDERRLVFRWASATEAPTVVELDLHPVGRRTRLTIVERPVRPGRVAGATARACALALAA